MPGMSLPCPENNCFDGCVDEVLLRDPFLLFQTARPVKLKHAWDHTILRVSRHPKRHIKMLQTLEGISSMLHVCITLTHRVLLQDVLRLVLSCLSLFLAGKGVALSYFPVSRPPQQARKAFHFVSTHCHPSPRAYHTLNARSLQAIGFQALLSFVVA
jgi:hypothetical protein